MVFHKREKKRLPFRKGKECSGRRGEPKPSSRKGKGKRHILLEIQEKKTKIPQNQWRDIDNQLSEKD